MTWESGRLPLAWQPTEAACDGARGV